MYNLKLRLWVVSVTKCLLTTYALRWHSGQKSLRKQNSETLWSRTASHHPYQFQGQKGTFFLQGGGERSFAINGFPCSMTLQNLFWHPSKVGSSSDAQILNSFSLSKRYLSTSLVGHQHINTREKSTGCSVKSYKSNTSYQNARSYNIYEPGCWWLILCGLQRPGGGILGLSPSLCLDRPTVNDSFYFFLCMNIQICWTVLEPQAYQEGCKNKATHPPRIYRICQPGYRGIRIIE